MSGSRAGSLARNGNYMPDRCRVLEAVAIHEARGEFHVRPAASGPRNPAVRRLCIRTE